MSSARIEALVIGDELLDGRVTDTNTVRFAQRLTELGATLVQRTTITDDIDVIVREARAVIARGTTLCLVSGGLGPTRDDLTAEAFAVLAGVPLVRDPAQVARIEQLLASRGRSVSDNQRKQADRPRDAELIENDVGTAPGFALDWGGCRFVAVPGVPHEFDVLVEKGVLSHLRALAEPREGRALYCFGLTEGEVDRRVADLAQRCPAVRVGFRAHFPEIHVTLKAAQTHRAELDEALRFTREMLGEHVYSERTSSLAEELVLRLRAAQATLVVAESCTGGLVQDLVTDVPGSSEALLGGVVAYANALKQRLVGVPDAMLVEHGAVSEPVVRAMAETLRREHGATHALAVSGIAGPSGGTPDKPVGTVWLAHAGPQGTTSRRIHSPYDRRRNKVLAAYAALDMLRRVLPA